MALTKVSRGLLTTSIVDNGNATAITIDSSENVGIGMTPSAWHANWTALQLGATGFVGQYQAGATDITALGSNVFSDGAYKYIETDEAVIYKQQNGEHIFDVAASGSANAAISWTTALTINNSGNVNIGSGASISPDADADNLVIQENGAAGITIGSSASSVGSIRFADSGSPRAGMIYYNHVGNEMRFYTNATEAYRITAARDMYFGQTSGSAASVGHVMQANGALYNTADGTTVQYLRRLNSHGDILQFNIDASAIGSIGSIGGNLSINGHSTLLLSTAGTNRVNVDSAQLYPNSNNTYNLGHTSNRFDDIYCVNVNESSDRNLKQDIEELSEAEQRVAVKAKGLLRKYRLVSSVTEKGDDARIHVGIIAQDLEAAFKAEGLDPSQYAMWCSDTWTDEDTGEEVTNQSIRYTQLLAFIISAI